MVSVLIADDDPADRLYIAESLRAHGHDVREAANGREAMAILSEGAIDVLITDVFMPAMDGLELIRAIRSRGTPVKIIAITAYVEEGDAKADYLGYSEILGADHVLAKPFSSADVTAKIEACLAAA